jgi:hypothetical protein
MAAMYAMLPATTRRESALSSLGGFRRDIALTARSLEILFSNGVRINTMSATLPLARASRVT